MNSSDVNITQPDSLYISSIIATNVSCNGGSDGSVLVTSLGGTLTTHIWVEVLILIYLLGLTLLQ